MCKKRAGGSFWNLQNFIFFKHVYYYLHGISRRVLTTFEMRDVVREYLKQRKGSKPNNQAKQYQRLQNPQNLKQKEENETGKQKSFYN